MASHKSIKRIFSRVAEEVHSIKKIAELTSWQGALSTFAAKVDIQIMNRNGFKEPEAVRKRLLKKHDVMICYFEKKFEKFLEEYNFEIVRPDGSRKYRDRIWICWWQGLDNAPEIVKKCIESIIKNAGNHEVTIVTEENYRDFVIIPSCIEDKFHKGIISRTHFSDILRLSLLAEHGGMWLDSTFFCTQPVLDNCFNHNIWTIRRPDYLHGSVACGQFATYSLACSSECRWVFATIRDFALHYWQTHDCLIDYLFLDYMFVLAQRRNPQIMELFRSVEPNNPCCDDLCISLGKPFDSQLWEELKKETSLFKLTWKQSFPKEIHGQLTFYGMLTEGKL